MIKAKSKNVMQIISNHTLSRTVQWPLGESVLVGGAGLSSIHLLDPVYSLAALTALAVFGTAIQMIFLFSRRDLLRDSDWVRRITWVRVLCPVLIVAMLPYTVLQDVRLSINIFEVIWPKLYLVGLSIVLSVMSAVTAIQALRFFFSTHQVDAYDGADYDGSETVEH